MSGWLLLLAAIGCEILATTALKFAGQSWLAVGVVIAGYALAFSLLGFALRELPLGLSYAIWSGLGTVGAVAAGAVLLGEPVRAAHAVGVAMILAGVAVLKGVAA